MKTLSKPRARYAGGYWTITLDGLVISSWPTLDVAWQRYKEYTE